MWRDEVKRIVLAACLGPALLLGACGEEAAEPAPAATDDTSPEGDVLEGSISDEMTPLDELRSQAPPLDPEGEDEGDESGDSDADESATDAD